MAIRSSLSLLPLVSFYFHMRATADAVSYNITGYDVGPDWSNDPFPPYPPLTDDKGNLIDAQNLRGTRLFGFNGCDSKAQTIIHSTYDDFYKLSHQNGLSANIAWKEEAAKDM
jgi:hypothetical protein